MDIDIDVGIDIYVYAYLSSHILPIPTKKIHVGI